MDAVRAWGRSDLPAGAALRLADHDARSGLTQCQPQGLERNLRGPGQHLPAGAAQRLVDHDARVGHGVALALGARSQQERAHGRGQAKAVRLHIRAAQLRNSQNHCLSTLHRESHRTALPYAVSRDAPLMLGG